MIVYDASPTPEPPKKQQFQFDFHVDHHAKVLTIDCQGEMTLDNCIEMIMSIRKMDESIHYYSRLYDLTDVKSADISVSEFDTILMNAKSAFIDKLNKVKVAFVTNDTLNFNLAIVFKTMSQRFQFQEVEVFSSRRAALLWFDDALGNSE